LLLRMIFCIATGWIKSLIWTYPNHASKFSSLLWMGTLVVIWDTSQGGLSSHRAVKMIIERGMEESHMMVHG
jgi:hypothetical protein